MNHNKSNTHPNGKCVVCVAICSIVVRTKPIYINYSNVRFRVVSMHTSGAAVARNILYTIWLYPYPWRKMWMWPIGDNCAADCAPNASYVITFIYDEINRFEFYEKREMSVEADSDEIIPFVLNNDSRITTSLLFYMIVERKMWEEIVGSTATRSLWKVYCILNCNESIPIAHDYWIHVLHSMHRMVRDQRLEEIWRYY